LNYEINDEAAGRTHLLGTNLWNDHTDVGGRRAERDPHWRPSEWV
jgi:hypothetical protein